MIVTEEEAKTKRCQESFGDQQLTTGGYVVPGPGALPYTGGGIGGIAIQTSPVMCIGSNCMAWRWHRETVYHPDPIHLNHFTELREAGDYSTTHGYCGKAGKP